MRKAEVFLHGVRAGVLTEQEQNRRYMYEYSSDYLGPAVSITMPVDQKVYEFDRFPPFFEGLLPEGANLDMLLRTEKIYKNDFFKY